MSPSKRSDRPVIVCGAGPVGLVTALRLAQADVPVVLLERERALSRDLRASTFHPPTLEMLDTLELTPELIARGLETPSWQIRVHETHEKVEFPLARIAADTRYPFRLQCEQWNLSELALQRAEADPRIDVRLGNELIDVAQSDDAVAARVRAGNGSEQELAAPFLVAADGGRSFVRGALGLPFEGLTYPETTVLATTTFPFAEHLPGLSNVNYVWMEGGTYSLLRLPDRWRCSLYAEAGESVEEALAPDRIEAKLQRIVATDSPYEVGEIRAYRIHQRIVREFRVGRILLAGDAAHLNSPSGGMGMNGGIHDAFNLTGKLPAVWRGEAGTSLLDTYSRQRRLIAREAILKQSHENRARMQQTDPEGRQRELRRLRAIASDETQAREFLLETSMIAGLKRAAEIH